MSEEAKEMRREKMQYLGELVNASLQNRSPKEVPQGIEVEEILKIARDGQMRTLVLFALSKLEWNEEWKKGIQQESLYCTMRSLAQVSCLRTVQELFKKSGIRFQVLKGAVMKQVYPRPELREMSDIDILVYEDSFEKADQVLVAEGFNKKKEIKHHAVYEKKPFIVLEAHWDLIDKSVDKNQHVHFKNDCVGVLKPDKEYEYEFSKEDFYVYMIAHMAKHFYEGGCGIRNLVDIYVYREKYGKDMDEAVLKEKLQKCGITDFEKHARELAYVWLNGQESSEFQDNLFWYMIDSGIYGKSENGIWSQMVKGSDNADKKKLKLWYLFPDKEHMSETYPWVEKCPILIGAAWIMRIVSALFREDVKDREKNLRDMDQKEIDSKFEIYKKMNLNYQK